MIQVIVIFAIAAILLAGWAIRRQDAAHRDAWHRNHDFDEPGGGW